VSSLRIVSFYYFSLLSAGETKVKERIDDYWKIVSQLRSNFNSTSNTYQSNNDPTTWSEHMIVSKNFHFLSCTD